MDRVVGVDQVLGVDRVVGVDVARGLAILGMFTAHVGDDDGARLWNGASLLEAADGRSAAMFALLAGVSAGFISGGAATVQDRLRHARVRILVRAAILLPLGALLAALGTRIAVILPGYAVMFAMLTVVLAWRPRALLGAAAVVLVVAPPVVFVARDALAGNSFGPLTYPADLVVGEYYPALVWIAYLLVGLALARLDLTNPAMPRRLLMSGLPLAVLAHGIGAVAVRAVPREHTLRRALLSAAPHDDSAVEVAGNIGIGLCVLAACLLLARYLPRWIEPLAATGALALTTYSAQIVVIAWLGDGVFARPSNLRLAGFIVGTLAVTTLWSRLIGRGPLEWVLRRASTSVADRFAPTGKLSQVRTVAPSCDAARPAQPGAPAPHVDGAGATAPTPALPEASERDDDR